MKMQNKTLFFVVSLLCLQMLSAQAMTVSGTVSDAQTGEALLGAQVFVIGTFVGTTTDDNGAFSLDIEQISEPFESEFGFHIVKRDQ